MKKRRNLLVALLLVCAMGIGVGYAAIADELFMNGSTTIAAQTAKLYFSAFTPGSNFTNDTTLGGKDVKTVNFTVTGLSEPGHVATGTYTITNDTDCPMTITNIAVATINDDGAGYYTVETDFDPSNPAATLAAEGGSMTVTVTVRQIKGWTGNTPLNSTCKITVSATSN